MLAASLVVLADPSPSVAQSSGDQPSGDQPSADLYLWGTASRNRVVVGKPVTYRVNVRNQGPSLAATGVVVTAVFPPHARLRGVPAGCSLAERTVTCRVGTLNSDDSFFFFLTVVPTARGTMRSTASVASDTPDPNSLNNTDEISTRVTRK